MLPWLFAVLLLANAVFFYWGHQRELAREPVPPPIPEGVNGIRLLAEIAMEAEPEPPVGTADSESEQARRVPAPDPDAPATTDSDGGALPAPPVEGEQPEAAQWITDQDSEDSALEPPAAESDSGASDTVDATVPEIDARGEVEGAEPSVPAAADAAMKESGSKSAEEGLDIRPEASDEDQIPKEPQVVPISNDPTDASNGELAPPESTAPRDIPSAPAVPERQRSPVGPADPGLLPRDPSFHDPDVQQTAATIG